MTGGKGQLLTKEFQGINVEKTEEIENYYGTLWQNLLQADPLANTDASL